MNIYIKTFGCKVNSFESAATAELLRARGHNIIESELNADSVIINSCTVTSGGDKKTQQYMRHIRRENPKCIIMLMGCFCQAFPDRAEKLSEADIVVGTGNRQHAVDLLCEFYNTHRRVVDIEPNRGKPYEPLAASMPDGHTRAFLKIEDGCDRYCSYCIIPYARGSVRSLPIGLLSEQIKSLAANGFSEIVLSGINLSCYGQGTDYDLADAAAVAALPEEIVRIRLGSLEADIITDEIIKKLASNSKLCPQFHPSLQSGCDATLKRMNRHYTTAEYCTFVDKLRASFDRATFTTDVIVGFPGETEQEFEQSLEFVESIGFLKVHVFPYSLRDGTVASKMPNQIDKAEKERRVMLMSQAAERSRERVMNSFVGTKARVILEQPTASGAFDGYTDRYLPALVYGNNLHGHDIVEGIIDRIEDDKCIIVLK